ncbi:TetR/AcrR family transcriptional regulator [Pseudodesulfovibrio piezophilus]|uniref:Putative Transcriptional regulator, TetR family n=1 Tax=Pseudodesulfovibrio piezophilus (strain DSM 21447 / JCM 15486 / C1TLV30) TaxID=1322246 RepID=M1WLU7_PSEP2|nr:TetR/AcrR family transcriptional regulator [Pseudodesulfovibrio piezophilus]CCH48480.1 putative Transcriptional regulator, TetR family [Pseudodesulfovibrio piezophilus C1TLV30]
MQLLEAAEECFATYGFCGAGMSLLSKTAKMSIGNIYGYFENKDAIVCALVEAQVQALQEGLQTLFEETDDVVEILQTQTRVQCQLKAGDKKIAIMFEIMAEMSRNPEVAKAMRLHDASVKAQLMTIAAEYRPHWSAETLDARIEMLMLAVSGIPLRLVMNPDLNIAGLVEEICTQIESLFAE